MGGPVRFQKQHRHIQNLEDDHKTIPRLNKGRPLKYIQLHLSKKSDKKTLKIFKPFIVKMQFEIYKYLHQYLYCFIIGKFEAKLKKRK